MNDYTNGYQIECNSLTPGSAVKTALTVITANDFPRRARRLAAKVALTKPDLIGLQEVFNITLDSGNRGPPFVDHLAETLKTLEQYGASIMLWRPPLRI